MTTRSILDDLLGTAVEITSEPTCAWADIKRADKLEDQTAMLDALARLFGTVLDVDSSQAAFMATKVAALFVAKGFSLK